MVLLFRVVLVEGDGVGVEGVLGLLVFLEKKKTGRNFGGGKFK